MSNRTVLFCLLIGGILISCEEKQEFILTHYPLEPGLERTFELKTTLSGDTLLTLTDTFRLEVSGTITLENGPELTELKYTSQTYGTGYEYLLNTDTALMDYGHQHFPSPIPVKKSFHPGLTAVFSNLSINPETPGEVIYPSPLKVFSYPLKEGQSWTVNTHTALGMLITKTVKGRSTVVTPAGTFHCLKIVYQYYTFSSSDIQAPVITEYISGAGLVKRVTDMGDFTLTSPEGNSLNGKQIRSVQVITLLSLESN